MIKLVGLGLGNVDTLTVLAYREIREAKRLFLRTEKFPIVEYLNKENINFESYDYAYEKIEDFDKLYEFIARDVIEKSKQVGEIVYAVPGHPLVAEKSVTRIIELCKKEKIEYKIIAATSLVDALMEYLEIDLSDDVKISDAFEIQSKVFNKRDNLIVTQIYNQLIASEVKLRLLDFYDDETEITYIKINKDGVFESRKLNLYELDQQDDMDHTTIVFIKQDYENKKDFFDLLEIIDILRSPNGCPWDMEQTHQSIKRELLEESYEVLDAIESNDLYALEEEIGDVLLHVVFHSSIAKENAEFTIADVINGICNKMIGRHQHVFKDKRELTSKDVLISWDETKKKEKGFETVTDEMMAVAKALPALVKATKVQKKAARVGFDFSCVEDAMDKVIEELNEIKDVYNTEKLSRIEEEVGDLIFSVVNVARLLKIDSEKALESTIFKFINRFSFIEKTAILKGKDLTNMSLEELDMLWEEIKSKKKD